jgi:Putative prokaryotic signal transducing protein
MSAHAQEDLVSVAAAGDRAEGDMIQALLESAGIPSVIQQVGVDGPQLGYGLLNPGGGWRRVLVRADQADAARALLAETAPPGEPEDWAGAELPEEEEASGSGLRNYGLLGAYARIWAWSLGAIALAFALFALSRMI